MGGSFYGWYFKCQSATQTLAVIPAIHKASQEHTCSIQIITDKDSWTITFPADRFHRKGRNIFIGENQFGEDGISLSLHTPELNIKGKVDFGPLSPLKYDIMGPFVLVPFLECRHRVWSMRHDVHGAFFINGEEKSIAWLLIWEPELLK